MSTETTLANEWVASYLDALLSSGLSTEHIRSAEQQQQRATTRRTEDDSTNIAARYYVHQILSLDEDHIRDAWSKANRPSRYGAHQAMRDARMEHLSWRVWTMKRRKAAVEAAAEADRKEAAAELLRDQGLIEEEDELAATTRLTIDELNSSTIAALEECGLADAGAFGSVAFEALPEGFLLDATASNQQKSPAKAADTTAAKDDKSAAPVKLPAGQELDQQVDSGKAPILTLAAAKAAAAGAGRGPPTLDTTEGTKEEPIGPLPPTPFATGQVSMGPKLSPATIGAVPPSALPGHATPLGGTSSPTNLSGAIQQPQQAAATADPLLVSRFPRLYIILISLHGLVRGEKMELGKDPDTGGQVKYVVELAKAMAQFPSVARVDLLTRLICDPKVDKSYWEPEERLQLPPLPPSAAAVAAHYGGTGEFPPANATAVAAELLAHDDGSPKSGNSVVEATAPAPANPNSARGAFICRLACGDPNVYLRKEDLWPHTREFADRAIAHAQATLQKLQEGGEGPCELYVVHGHYADAGEVAAMVSSSLGADCVLTGHSLGRNKKEHLLKSGTMSIAEVEATYRISRRIEAEERALDAASVVFTSTQQEVAEQWGTYDGYSDQLSAALQLRPCKGYHVPRMAVIPPGLDFSNLKVSMPQDPWEEVLGNCPLPHNPALTPAGGSGANMGVRANGIQGTPPLSPRNSNLPLPSPKLSPRSSQQPSALPAPSEVETTQGTSFNSTVPPVAMDGAANISFMVCPCDRKPSGSGQAAGTCSSPNMPGTPASILSSTPLTPTNAGSSAGNAGAGSNPLSPKSTDSRDNSKPLGQLKINVPGIMVAPENPHVPATNGNGDAKGSKAVNEAVAACLALPDGLDLSVNPGQGSALVKRKSTSGLAGTATPPNHLHTRASYVPGNNGEANSRRQSHIGAEGNRSVAATPRSPGPHNLMGLHPGKMNPRVLAAMMVGESEPAIWKEINRFLRHPGRPVILAMSRPDAKKNILALVRAYGQNRVLRDLANLVLIMGNRDVIDGMAPGSTRVLTDVLKLVDTYDLYGQVAYPKKHTQNDISDIYLLAAATRGVFVNIALQEPFGLTLIEAAAHGAPIVATKNGGPVDIVRTLKNGVLVEPTDTNAIAEACVSLITSQRTWEEYSDNGRNNITAYSWPSHCARYLRTIQNQRSSRMPQYGGQDTHAQAAPPRIRHTLSLSYDDLSNMARAIAKDPAMGNNIGDNHAHANKQALNAESANKANGDKEETGGNTPAGSGSAPWLDDLEHHRPQQQAQAGLRIGSMPPQSAAPNMGPMVHARGSRGPKMSPVASGSDIASMGGRSETEKSQPSGFQAASMAVVEELDTEVDANPTPGTLSKAGSGVPPLSTHPVYLQPRLTRHDKPKSSSRSTEDDQYRRQFVVFNIDTLADVKACSPLIRALVGGGLSTTNAEGSSSGWSEADLQACFNELNGDCGAGQTPGVGVLCTWSARDMRALLSKEGVNPLSLDFMVCNAGALIWHAMASDAHQIAPAGLPVDDSNQSQQQDTTAKPAADAPAAPVEPSSGSGTMMQRAGSLGLSLLGMGRNASGENPDMGPGAKDVTLGTSWMCDDQWEHHVDFRWDDRVVLQVLRRILDNKTGWGKLHIVRPAPTGSTTTKPIPQPAGTTAVNLRMSPKCTPYHYMVDVDVAGSVGGRAPLPPNEVAQQLLAAMRRKLRMCGLRAQLTVTPRESLPSSNDTSRKGRGLSAIAGNILTSLLSRTASNAAVVAPDGSPNSMTLHITPSRCSRPLALRHLASKFKKPLDSAWTVVACTTSAATPESAILSTTDGEDLLAGVQKVTLIPTTPAGVLAFPVDISVFGATTTTVSESEKARARLRLFTSSNGSSA